MPARKGISKGAAFACSSSLAILALVLVGVPGQADGTVLIVTGATCLAGLEAAQAAVGPQLEAQGLEPVIDTIRNFCRLALNLSPEYQLLRLLEPPLRRLLDVIDEVPLDTPQGFEQLTMLLQNVAQAVGG